MTEREWREASDLRPSGVGLAIVLVTAAFLRFWALGHGIPFALGVDEPEILERAVNAMRSGSFNPGFHDYPGLYIHLQTFVAIARFMTGAVAGHWSSLDQAPTWAFYLWGRGMTAILGVATVLLVFQIGMRWGARHALLAAGLLAVLPSHVRESHYVLTDVPLTFFVALTMLLALRAHEAGSLGAFALAGAAAGLAAATKYNGALALVIPLLACWMTREARPSRLACALTSTGAAVAAMLLTAPYMVLDLPGFLNGFARLASEYRTTSGSAEPIWILYLKYLRLSFQWPGMLLVAGGLVLGLVRLARGPGRVRWAIVTLFPLIYYAFISRQSIVFGRYLLPMTPALCLLASCAVISGVSLLRRYEIPRAPRRLLIAALTIAAVLPPGLVSVAFNRTIARKSTAALAYEWIAANIPPKSSIVIESRGLLLPPGYRADNVPQLRRRTYEEYSSSQVQYLVASSQVYGPFLSDPQIHPREYADYMRIFGQAREIVRFAPSADHPGPELRILKVAP
ncbi:MAG TPA: phospholipid carrier-dependent glycosyltransferase [Vicinamibacterales bacterium]|nr:phospholipid carrier-dependent glycosyltransferase [Vicinamibacterales bacterium]